MSWSRAPGVSATSAGEMTGSRCRRLMRAVQQGPPGRMAEGSARRPAICGRGGWRRGCARSRTRASDRPELGRLGQVEPRCAIHRGGGLRRPARRLYAPNGDPRPGPKFDGSIRRLERLEAHAAERIAAGMPALLIGDFIIVPADGDIYAVRSHRENALLQPEPRAAFARRLRQGWTDALGAARAGDRHVQPPPAALAVQRAEVHRHHRRPRRFRAVADPQEDQVALVALLTARRTKFQILGTSTPDASVGSAPASSGCRG